MLKILPDPEFAAPAAPESRSEKGCVTIYFKCFIHFCGHHIYILYVPPIPQQLLRYQRDTYISVSFFLGGKKCPDS
jgi:hypothetical protein